MRNKDLKRRIIEISYKNKLCHIGSCITAVDIIEGIYQLMKPSDKFVLSCGHAGVALYVVLEKHLGLDADALFEKHGVHPNRDPKNGIEVSTGSLGHGLAIAVGMALADRNRKVYCLLSDGECAEGLVWEALRVKREQKLDNLIVYCNYNRWAAYRKVPIYPLFGKLVSADVTPVFTDVEQLPCLKGQEAHYRILSKGDYEEAMEILK